MSPLDALPQAKAPPHSTDAEQAVLGGLLVNNRAWHEVRGVVGAEDFYTQSHRAIFHGIGDLLDDGDPADYVTLAEKLRQQGNLEIAGGAEAVYRLALDTPSAASVKHHAQTVRRYATLRQLIASGHDIAALGYEPGEREPGELVNAAEALVAGIHAQAALGEMESLHQVIGGAMEAAQARRKLKEAGKDVGATTGLPTVDEAMGAFARGCLYVIAARPGAGKTAMLSQLAMHSARRGFPGYIASLEMSRTQLGARAAAHLTGGNATELLRGYGRAIEATELRLCTTDAHALPLYVDTLATDLDAICSRMFEAKRRYGIQWAAVDHLGLIRGVRAASRNDYLGEITWALKRTAKRLDIAILALSQLSRANEKEHRRPMLADLRDSGNIEQDADLVMFIHDPREKESVFGVLPRRDIGLFKNRDGREGWLPAEFQFEGRSQTFAEISRTYESRRPAESMPPTGSSSH